MKYKKGDEFIASSKDWNETYHVTIIDDSSGDLFSLYVREIGGDWESRQDRNTYWLNKYCKPYKPSKLEKAMK